MIPINISKSYDNKNNYIALKKFILSIFIFVLFFLQTLIKKNKISKDIEKLNRANECQANSIISEKMDFTNQKCYFFSENQNIRITHLIITRFLIDFYRLNGFPKKLYSENYISNGIRVMKKYLLSSLENQSCKNFTWILMIGNKANITSVKSLLNFNNSFDMNIIYQKDLKNYVRKVALGFDVLITTRIDYDDRIYYDAVNDVRKAININRPMILYGYNRGFIYFESNDEYYSFEKTRNKNGVMSVFISLITVLNMVNDTYTVYDIGGHNNIRKSILTKYKSYGIKDFDYEPTVFDSGGPKFVWVRQKYSGYYIIKRQINKKLKVNNFNLRLFYGK